MNTLKIDTEVLVDNDIIEKFQKLKNYIKWHEAEVEEVGTLSLIENNFSETELAMLGELVLNELLLNM